MVWKHGKAQRRAVGTGYEFLVGMAIGLYIVFAVTQLVTGFIRAELTFPIELTESGASSVDFGTVSAKLSGLTEVTVQTADLAVATVVFIVIAKIVLILTFAGAGIAIVPIVRAIAAGTPFVESSLRSLTVLIWVIAGGYFAYAVTITLGTNLASRDLGIADVSGPGVSLMQSFLVLGIAGGIELLRRCFISGRTAQEELEGLV